MGMVEVRTRRWDEKLLRFRPEEWLFLALTVVLIGITIKYGVGESTLWKIARNWRFVAIVGAMGVLIFLRGWYHHRGLRGALLSTGRTLREFSPLWACIIIYETLHDLTPLIRPVPVDASLIAIDHAVFGVDVGRWLNDNFGSAILTEILVLCYSSYGIAIPSYAAYLFLKGRTRPFRDLSLGISLTAVLGYIGYITVPAIGPYLFQPDVYSDPLPHFSGTPGTGLLAAINNLKGTDALTSARDCFPSLHTAMTTVLLVTVWRNNDRRIFWSYFPVALGLYTATLYLRVHYAVDVAAGFATAAFVLWLTPKINDWWYSRREMSYLEGDDLLGEAADDAEHAEHEAAAQDDRVVAVIEARVVRRVEPELVNAAKVDDDEDETST